MNNFRNLCLLVVFTLGVSHLVHGQCTTMGAQGGGCIKRGTTEFVEDTVYQFQFEFTYGQYEELLSAYTSDPDFNAYRVAGLGFVPVIDTLSETLVSNATTTLNQVKYATIGLRAVLVLWQGKVVNGQNLPEEIIIFGFGNIEKAFTISAQKFQADDDHFVELTSNLSKRTVNDALVTNSREFDIVFLDSLEFEYLARSGDFYNLQQRPTLNGQPHEGIIIERAFGTIRPGTSDVSLTNYRTLLFKPSPIPALSSEYNSEAAVAFRYGEHCPPFWIDPSKSVQACNDNPAVCFFKGAIQKRKIETVIVGGGKIPWLKLIVIVLGLLGLTVFITRALSKGATS